MCQIISVPAGKEVNFSKLDKAQKYNSDGYGVSWYEDKQVKTYRSMNYKTFKKVLRALTPYTKVVHLRYTTVGETNISNCHPFDVPNGAMFHNGTITSLKPKGHYEHGKWKTAEGSDSKALANLLMNCWYDSVMDIEPLLTEIIGTTINRLVFLEGDGTVTIINEELGEEEDGIWYSNDYHKKADNWSRYGYTHTVKKVTPAQVAHKMPSKDEEEEEETNTTTVFVYGTLKRGYGNYTRFLSHATFLGKATTVFKWTMMGKGAAFPYVVLQDETLGHNIRGEVFSVTDAELATLDSLEGVSSGHYKKILTNIQYDDDVKEMVTMYVACNKPYGYDKAEYIAEWQR